MATSKKTNQKQATATETVVDKLVDNVKENISSEKITGIVGTASRIVFRAANILEEEIARGIVAAKQIEEKFTDVPKLRTNPTNNNRKMDELLLRFRKDAHDIIDLVLDFAAIAAQNAEKITSNFIKVKQSNKTTEPVSQVSLIKVPKDLKAGEESEFPVTLENDNPTESRTLEFENTPFTDTSGNQLPSGTLGFNPNPLIIPPGSRATVNMRVKIPPKTKSGSYTSFIQAKNIEALKATVLIKVV